MTKSSRPWTKSLTPSFEEVMGNIGSYVRETQNFRYRQFLLAPGDLSFIPNIVFQEIANTAMDDYK